MCSWGGSLRYRSGGGRTQSQNELTVEELRSFVTQLDGLPCVIRQAPLLKVSPGRPSCSSHCGPMTERGTATATLVDQEVWGCCTLLTAQQTTLYGEVAIAEDLFIFYWFE